MSTENESIQIYIQSMRERGRSLIEQADGIDEMFAGTKQDRPLDKIDQRLIPYLESRRVELANISAVDLRQVVTDLYEQGDIAFTVVSGLLPKEESTQE